MTPLAYILGLVLLISAALSPRPAFAESQGNEYRGITDPFGDPSNYEFSEDEKEDKEFFHLGRYLMFGLDFGAGIFTGGLGTTTLPTFYIGARLQYFFDKSLCFEASGHYANHQDLVQPDANSFLDMDLQLINILVGFRYYFDTKGAPKAIAIANPYLALGGGFYMRDLAVIQQQGNFQVQTGGTNAFGAQGGGGVEFSIYRRHIYLGLDLRYHLIFFPDKDTTLGNRVPAGSRDGGYLSVAGTLTYNF